MIRSVPSRPASVFSLSPTSQRFQSPDHAHYSLGRVHSALGNYHQAVELLRKNVTLLTGDLSRERFGLTGLASVSSSAELCEPLAELGEFAEGIAYGEEAIRIAEVVDHPFSRVHAYWGIGNLYLTKATSPRPSPCSNEVLHSARARTFCSCSPCCLSLGAAFALSGRSAEALPLLEQAIEQAPAGRLRVYLPRWTIRLGEGHLLAGRIEAAIEARRALTLARDATQRGLEAWALRLLGKIAAQQEPPAVELARSITDGHGHCQELGMRPLLAHCHLGLGTCMPSMDDGRKRMSHCPPPSRSTGPWR